MTIIKGTTIVPNSKTDVNVTGGIIESSESVLIWRSISFFNILHRLILVIRSEGIIYAEGEGKGRLFISTIYANSSKTYLQ